MEKTLIRKQIFIKFWSQGAGITSAEQIQGKRTLQ